MQNTSSQNVAAAYSYHAKFGFRTRNDLLPLLTPHPDPDRRLPTYSDDGGPVLLLLLGGDCDDDGGTPSPPPPPPPPPPSDDASSSSPSLSLVERFASDLRVVAAAAAGAVVTAPSRSGGTAAAGGGLFVIDDVVDAVVDVASPPPHSSPREPSAIIDVALLPHDDYIERPKSHLSAANRGPRSGFNFRHSFLETRRPRAASSLEISLSRASAAPSSLEISLSRVSAAMRTLDAWSSDWHAFFTSAAPSVAMEAILDFAPMSSVAVSSSLVSIALRSLTTTFLSRLRTLVLEFRSAKRSLASSHSENAWLVSRFESRCSERTSHFL